MKSEDLKNAIERGDSVKNSVKVMKKDKADKKKNSNKKAKNIKKIKPDKKDKPSVKNYSDLSMSLEDYLEKIYILSGECEEVRVTDIAQALGLSKPSVNRAVNTLTNGGYLMHAHYGSIELTQMGHSVAKGIYKRHKVLKQFLVQCLGVDKSVAEQESYNMKHFLSKGTYRKLKNFVSEY